MTLKDMWERIGNKKIKLTGQNIVIAAAIVTILIGGKVSHTITVNNKKQKELHEDPSKVVESLESLGEIDPETSKKLQEMYADFSAKYKDTYEEGSMNSSKINNVDRSLYNIYMVILCDKICNDLGIEKTNLVRFNVIGIKEKSNDKYYVVYRCNGEEKENRYELPEEIGFMIRSLEQNQVRYGDEVKEAKNSSIDLLLSNFDYVKEKKSIQANDNKELVELVQEMINYMKGKKDILKN